MKKIWVKIKLKFGALFSKFRKIINKHIDPAIKVTNIIKEIVENPAMSIAVAMTPFKWDDEGVRIAKLILPRVLEELNILKLSMNGTNAEIIAKIIDEVRRFTPSAKAKFYEDLAARLAAYLSDGELSISEAAELVTIIYEQKFKNK